MNAGQCTCDLKRGFPGMEPCLACRKRDEAISLLADNLNQLCIAIEEIAYREAQGAGDRIQPKAERRWQQLRNAARTVRDRIGELIPE